MQSVKPLACQKRMTAKVRTIEKLTFGKLYFAILTSIRSGPREATRHPSVAMNCI